MNPTSQKPLGENHISENLIEFYYLEWLSYYEQSLWTLQDTTITNNEVVSEAFRVEAIKSLNKSLVSIGIWEQQLMKISAFLLLIRLHDDEWAKEIRETYFYSAVDLARQYLWEDFQDTPEGEEIILSYLSNINPTFQNMFRNQKNSYLIKVVLKTAILWESKKRAETRKLEKERLEEVQLKEMEYIRGYLGSNHPSDEIIEKLEGMFGMIRLLIISENSGETVINHRFEKSEMEVLKKNPINARYTTVDIFDKPRKYTVMVDRGESADWFKEHHLNNVINLMIDCFIKRREWELFRNALGNGNETEAIEKDIGVLPLEGNDYHALIADILGKSADFPGFPELGEDRGEYIDIFLKALNICRNITFHYEKNEMVQLAGLSQEINHILWGKVERRVFSMIKSMLLSRNETMNGSGYPFGLSKKNIPLEWRIYMIIRAYEVLSFTEGSKQALKTMEDWAQGGYFDGDILRIFIEHLGDGTFPKSPKKSSDEIPVVSAYRFFRYTSFMKSCSELLGVMEDIKNACYNGRMAEGDTETQNILFKEANELRVKLLRTADIRKVIIVTRHGETISDTPGWIPGNEDEILTEVGRESSLRKWALFRGLHLRIFTSPLIRARQTAAIICQEVRRCVRDIIPIKTGDSYTVSFCKSTSVTIEETITNPRKNQENDRYDDLLSKFVADSNTRWLGEFLKKLVSSGEETMNLFITHRDSWRHLIFWLNNIFSQEQIFGKKTVIENDTVYEFVFRWAKLLSGEDQKTRGLLFSIRTWKTVVSELNILAEKAFGKVFYHLDDRQINLIVLHDRFLDFIDGEGEQNPEALILFIEEIKQNPDIEHIYPILEQEDIVDFEKPLE